MSAGGAVGAGRSGGLGGVGGVGGSGGGIVSGVDSGGRSSAAAAVTAAPDEAAVAGPGGGDDGPRDFSFLIVRTMATMPPISTSTPRPMRIQAHHLMLSVQPPESFAVASKLVASVRDGSQVTVQPSMDPLDEVTSPGKVRAMLSSGSELASSSSMFGIPSPPGSPPSSKSSSPETSNWSPLCVMVRALSGPSAPGTLKSSRGTSLKVTVAPTKSSSS